MSFQWSCLEDRLYVTNTTKLINELEPGNYALRWDNTLKTFYLAKRGPFELPDKLYGDFSSIERYLSAFHAFDHNVGILLNGLKGTGKTLFAKKLCIESNLPVILIENEEEILEFSNKFLDFFNNPLLNECIVFIDEFEKKFCKDDEDQEILLSLYDGTSSNKLLFLMTTNEANDISKYFTNRLGRIRYRKTYESLPPEVIEAVIEDLLENQTYKGSVIEVIKDYIATYDVLINIIKECNLFNKPAYELVSELNLKKEYKFYYLESNSDKYKLTHPFKLELTLRNESMHFNRAYYPFRFSCSDGPIDVIVRSEDVEVLYDEDLEPYFYIGILHKEGQAITPKDKRYKTLPPSEKVRINVSSFPFLF